jgi:uncharacterized protein (TIGR03086 family)
MAELIRSVPDDLLGAPTPCPAYTLGDLIDHVGGLSLAFTAAATKTGGELLAQGPSGDAARLAADWRTDIPRDLVAMAEAWRDPEAWTGMTQAGGVDLPGEVAGLVALDELVVHGWDVARASSQPFACDAASAEAVLRFLEPFSAQPDQGAALFGPVVPVSDRAPLVDRVVGLAGRNPGWSPSP